MGHNSDLLSSSTTSSQHHQHQHHHHHTHIHHHKDGTHTTHIHTEEGRNSDHLLTTSSSTNTTVPTAYLGPTLPTIPDTSLDEPMEVELGQGTDSGTTTTTGTGTTAGAGTTTGAGTCIGIDSKERVTDNDYSTVHPDLFRRRFVPKYEVYSRVCICHSICVYVTIHIHISTQYILIIPRANHTPSYSIPYTSIHSDL